MPARPPLPSTAQASSSREGPELEKKWVVVDDEVLLLSKKGSQLAVEFCC